MRPLPDEIMRWSLSISAFLHTALLLSAALALPDPEKFDVAEPVPIPVDIMTVEEFNNLRAQRETAEESEQAAAEPVEAPPVEAPPPEPVAEGERVAIVEPQAEPPPPEPAPEVQPQPEPEPAPVQEAAPEPDPVADASYPLPLQKPTPPRRTDPAPQQEQFDLDRIAALLDKSVEENQAPPPEPEQEGSPDRGQANTSGSADRLSQSALNYLSSLIDPCWNRPVGALGAETLVVVVQFSLNQDGSVDGVPEILNSNSSPQFRAAAEAVRRAVLRCQPFALPAEYFPLEKYGVWGEVKLTADPSRGLGG